MTTYEISRDRYLCVPGGSVRVLEPARKSECTLMERRSTVGCYVVMDNGDVWCMYQPCAHGYTEATILHPLSDDGNNEPPTVRPVAAQ